MSLTPTQQFQVDMYGQLLTGTETELELARLERITYLKQKMRPRLTAAIGDTPDNVTDVVRALVLGEAIHLGIVTDSAVLEAYTGYIQSMLTGYGGPVAILSVLSSAAQAIGQYVVAGYFAAKQQILASEDIEEIRMIDLDD